MSDWDEDPDIKAWLERADRELAPKIRESATTVSIFPSSGETDPKFAIELGYSIMLDKPIILAVQPGQKVPAKIALCADEIIEFTHPPTATQVSSLYAAINRLTTERLDRTDG